MELSFEPPKIQVIGFEESKFRPKHSPWEDEIPFKEHAFNAPFSRIEQEVMACRTAGFGPGCIVCRKIDASHERRNPERWGIVISLQKFVQASGVHWPIRVAWLNGAKTAHTRDDLFIIHE